jgi:mycofactocin precursor
MPDGSDSWSVDETDATRAEETVVDEALAGETLVEDVSIDGMCGVY